MQLIDIIMAIIENGFLVIAGAVIIWVYLRNEKERSKRADEAETRRIEREKEQVAQYQQMFSAMSEQMTRQADQIETLTCPDIRMNPVEEDIFQEEIDRNINTLLKKLRLSTSSCRTMLVRYHNGMYDLAGNSASRMSATNEDVGIGIVPFLPSFQNQFRGLFSYWCSEIRDKGYCYIHDLEYLKSINENAMYEFLSYREMKSWYGKAIYSNAQEVIGFIVVEYISENRPEIEEIEKCLNDKSIKISALLGLNSRNEIQGGNQNG